MANNNHFELTLDTLAPTGSITRPAQFCKAQEVCTIAKGDATFMYVWTDKVANPSFNPATKTRVAAANSYTTECDGDGVYYAHVVLMDDVNNRSAVLTTQSITYDLTAPEVKDPNDPEGLTHKAVEITLRDGTKTEITRTREVAITFYFTDELSGVASYTLSGDLADDVTKTGTFSAQELAANKATRNIVLSGTGEEDTSKTVSVTVTDNSGNTSAAVSDSIILDTEFLTGNIVLKQGTKQINGQWTNTAPVTVELALDHKTEDDVVAYKIFGAGLADPDTNWVSVTKGSAISVAKNFSTGDSDNKVVQAMVRDDAGNETILKSVFAKVDYSDPTVSIAIKSGETPYVSKVSGFTTKDLVPTVDASISGIASYTWKMDGNPYPDGTGTTAPTEFQVDSVNMGAGGAKVAKSFTLTVVDNAGNTTTSEPVVVYLDTVAPTGSITMPAWLNGDAADQTTYKKFSTAGATASATDGGAGLAYMTCWCSTTATDTTVVGTQVTYAANPTHSQIDWTKHAESATNYIHIKYVDAVGNAIIIHSEAFGIDTVAPANGTVAFTRDAYPSTSAAVNLTFSDATSGMGTGAKFKIWGNITEAATEVAAKWQAIAASKSVTLTTGDGEKTVSVKYMDVAGNMSVTAVTDVTELDTSTPTGALTLYNTDEQAEVDAIRNIPDFVTHISYTDADDLGSVFYQVYGAFTYNSQAAQGLIYKACTVYEPNKAYAVGDEILHNEGETKVYRVTTAVTAAQNTGWSAMNAKVTESTVWLPFVYDSGEQYKAISNMYCTSGDGQKDVYLRVMDNAGNISNPVGPRYFIYDTTPPEVTVTDVDHNRISKVHEYRYTSTGATTKYADETHFTFTPDSEIQAYKVCAYEDQAAAEAGSHADDAIGSTGGSVNMSATGLSSNAAVNAMIRGADFEAALGEAGEVDGAHIVVVYVQDLGGTWSAAASFEA